MLEEFLMIFYVFIKVKERGGGGYACIYMYGNT